MSDRHLLAGLFLRTTSLVAELWLWWWGTTTWTGDVLTLTERFLAGGARPAGHPPFFARPPTALPLPTTTALAPTSATRRVLVALAMVSVAEFFNFSDSFTSSVFARNNVSQLGNKGRHQVSARPFGYWGLLYSFPRSLIELAYCCLLLLICRFQSCHGVFSCPKRSVSLGIWFPKTYTLACCLQSKHSEILIGHPVSTREENCRPWFLRKFSCKLIARVD